MLKSCTTEIPENLRDMIRRNCDACLQFDDQLSLYKKIGDVVPERRPILVIDIDGVLLLEINRLFLETVGKRV